MNGLLIWLALTLASVASWYWSEAYYDLARRVPGGIRAYDLRAGVSDLPRDWELQ